MLGNVPVTNHPQSQSNAQSTRNVICNILIQLHDHHCLATKSCKDAPSSISSILYRMKTFTASLTFILACAVQANAAFTLIDDFESGTDSWTVGTGANFSVTADPTNGTNSVLSFDHANDNGAFATLSLDSSTTLNGGTGTLFLRAYMVSNDADTVFGLGDQGPSGNSLDWGAYESAVRFGFEGSSDLDVRDGGTYTTATGDTKLGHWYNLWFVIDDSNNQTDFYIQSDTDSDFSSQTVVYTDAAFRNGGSNPLNRLLIKAGNAAGGAILFDEIHIDTSGVNLASPIPEASTFALLAGWLSLASTLLRRRRRR